MNIKMEINFKISMYKTDFFNVRAMAWVYHLAPYPLNFADPVQPCIAWMHVKAAVLLNLQLNWKLTF